MRTLKFLMMAVVVLGLATACEGGYFTCEGGTKGRGADADSSVGLKVCTQEYQYSFPGISGLSAFLASLISSFDAADFNVDLSSSNVPVTTVGGYATVVLDLKDGSTQARSFEWVRLGDRALVASPATVNAWVQPLLSSVRTINVRFDFEVQSREGVNVVATELNHQGLLIAGSSDSWYFAGNGGCEIGWCETR